MSKTSLKKSGKMCRKRFSKEESPEERAYSNFDKLKSFMCGCPSVIDTIHIEDVMKYPVVAVKLTSLEGPSSENKHSIARPIKNNQHSLHLISHIDQLSFLLRETYPINFFTKLPVDLTNDVIQELSGNPKWFSRIKEKTYTITKLDEYPYWNKLRVSRAYILLNKFCISTEEVSEIVIEETRIRVSDVSGKSTTFEFDVGSTITLERLNRFMALSRCISGVDINIQVDVHCENSMPVIDCLESLGSERKNIPSSTPSYVRFQYLTLGPLAVALEQPR